MPWLIYKDVPAKEGTIQKESGYPDLRKPVAVVFDEEEAKHITLTAYDSKVTVEEVTNEEALVELLGFVNAKEVKTLDEL